MFLWTLMAGITQLWCAAHRSERRPDGPNPYPVVSVVDNRAEGRLVEPVAPELELLAA